MTTPEKALKEKRKEERKREKLRDKLEKKFQSGKIDNETYLYELRQIGYFPQKEFAEDLKRMIQEEITHLENLEIEDDASRTPPPPPPPPPPPDMNIHLNDNNVHIKKELDFNPPNKYEQSNVRDDEPETSDRGDLVLDELSEDSADWVIDEEPDDDDDLDDEDDFIDDEHTHEPDVIKIDHRGGVIDYDEINRFDPSRESVIDRFQDAAVIGYEGGKKKKRKKVKRKKEEMDEPELTEAEKLILEMEAAPEEELDLDDVFIPDIESSLISKGPGEKSRKEAPDILWEADVEDRIWLEKRFSDEAKALKKRYGEWRLAKQTGVVRNKEQKRKRLEAKAEDWQLVKIMLEQVLVRVGKKLKKRKKEIWKVRVKPKEGKRKDERGKDQRVDKKDEGPGGAMKMRLKEAGLKAKKGVKSGKKQGGKSKLKKDDNDDDHIEWL